MLQLADVDKLVATSNVVNKVIEVAIGEDQNLSNVEIEQTSKVKMI
jgi:uncharacterized protein YdcH (DUF465 family)